MEIMVNININLSAKDNLTVLNNRIKELQNLEVKKQLTNKAQELQSYLDNYNTSDSSIYKLIIKGNKIIGIEKTENRL